MTHRCTSCGLPVIGEDKWGVFESDCVACDQKIVVVKPCDEDGFSMTPKKLFCERCE